MRWRDKFKWPWQKKEPGREVVPLGKPGRLRPGRPTLVCPRCRRTVEDTPRGRGAHRQSCVKIPHERPPGWGVKRG